MSDNNNKPTQKTQNNGAKTTTTPATTKSTTTTTSNCKATVAGKSGPGAGRKFSFLDALSPEERALFEEHARDDDDVASSSGNRKAATATSADKAEPTATSSSRLSCSEEDESKRGGTEVRKRKRKRGGRMPPEPAAGCPGGPDDPRRRGMSGATLKWYLRHLQDGKSPEEAFRLATSRSRGSNPSPAAKKHANAASVAGRGSQTFSRGNATQPGKQGSGKAEPRNTTDQTAKRKSGQITPQEPPSSKRQKGNQPPAIGGQRSAPNPNPSDGGQRKYSEALKGIRMAVLPRNYPAEVLGN
nr:uncharacterized protein LOC118683417 [Bactrocera oleae]